MKTKMMAMLSACVISGGAHAQIASGSSSPWSVGVGAVNLNFYPHADMTFAGNSVPGAAVKVDSDTVFGVEIAYALTPSWTARLDLGTPVKTTLNGSGTALGPLGRLGGIKAGPAIATITYSPGMLGPIRPYFGGGLTYVMIFSSSNGAVQNLKVDNNFGGVLTLGADWPLFRGYSIGLSVQKLFVKVNATGNVGNAPVTANVRLDPLVTFLSLRKQF